MLNAITLMENAERLQQEAHLFQEKYKNTPSTKFPEFAKKIAMDIFIDLDDQMNTEKYLEYEIAIKNIELLGKTELYCLDTDYNKETNTQIMLALAVRGNILNIFDAGEYTKNNIAIGMPDALKLMPLISQKNLYDILTAKNKSPERGDSSTL